ncbi:DUF4426 domain-containing protein [Thaumasiovibrio subtropicus]|uniref:DUF4426 domain-containing protein n=1 Tax=Thaumasiovibrio subtropicus TaxID=1891207 RepID=UPI000B35EEB8|nr:DUF4426 domain-containing protein [Thaumasiovibrio subtropicus]
MKQLLTLVTLVISLFGTHANAEQFVKFDQLEVHYSAIPTTFLSAEIARSYQIQRSKYAALLNIAVLDTAQNNQPAIAFIRGEAVNLLGHKTPLTFREIREGEAVYYLAEVKHTNEERFKFTIDVTTAGGVTNTLNFQQTFYTDN